MLIFVRWTVLFYLLLLSASFSSSPSFCSEYIHYVQSKLLEMKCIYIYDIWRRKWEKTMRCVIDERWIRREWHRTKKYTTLTLKQKVQKTGTAARRHRLIAATVFGRMGKAYSLSQSLAMKLLLNMYDTEISIYIY